MATDEIEGASVGLQCIAIQAQGVGLWIVDGDFGELGLCIF